VSFLAAYQDLALDVSAKDTPAGINAEEAKRLSRTLAMVILAGGIPRRLGADATGEELAIDKRRAKRVAHVLKQSLTAWNPEGQPLAIDPDIKKDAAQLDWEQWWIEHRKWLENRITYVATWASKIAHKPEDIQWAKKAVVRLQNELNWTAYALRD